jgi:hypothetical protein
VSGTSLAAGRDLENRRASATFSVPALFGFSGEARLLDGFAYFRSTMTGPTWFRQPLDETDMPEVEDPAAALAHIRDFLADELVELRKLDDAECGDDTCYHVQLAIPAQLLDDAAEEVEGGLPPSGGVAEVIGPALVIDMLFDKERGYLRQAATAISNPDLGELRLTLTLGGFNEPVLVEAPAEDEVQDADAGGFPFP